jgi:hypothetical protein
VESTLANQEPWTEETADREAAGKRNEKIAIALFATGGVAVATGTVLYLLGRRSESAITVGTAGAPASVSWTTSF